MNTVEDFHNEARMSNDSSKQMDCYGRGKLTNCHIMNS